MKSALMSQKFAVPGRLVTVQAHGSGNVNDTYLVIYRTPFDESRFVLQRINKNVFPKPEWVMENMQVITQHVHARIEAEADQADRIWQLPKVIPATNGEDYVLDADGGFWRAISFISSAHSYEKVQSEEHAYQAGLVLGHFQRMISDLDPEKLHDTLPGFHVTPSYLEKYDKALATSEGKVLASSSADARSCLAFIEERRGWCSILEDACARGELSLRPIHGDPKIANIMIDDLTAKGTSIVDLDTVKPGLIHYDIGDCLRSCCNRLGEETTDLENVVFDTDYCEAILRGYMANAGEFLTDADRHYLYDAARLITFELGLRFYADFLAGDVYFKTSHEGQNLNRARVQFQLCKSIENQRRKIQAIIDDC